MDPAPVQIALDLVGVFVFGLSGGLAAVRARLDLFGVVVVAAVTALGGGVLRDTLLGANPPYTFRHWPYLVVPVVAGAVAFWLHPQVRKLRKTVLVLDAAGLGLFTVTGTSAALDARLGWAAASVLGVITGIGGGIIRDILLRQIPVVLQREIYAVAALVGALLVCLGHQLKLERAPWLIATAVVVFVLRVLALRRQWQAPVARYDSDQVGA